MMRSHFLEFDDIFRSFAPENHDGEPGEDHSMDIDEFAHFAREIGFTDPRGHGLIEKIFLLSQIDDQAQANVHIDENDANLSLVTRDYQM